MNKYIIRFISAVAFLSAAACSKFDEMNKNPYAVYEAPAESFVQPILYNTEYTLVTRCYDLMAELMQYSLNINTEVTSQMNYNYSITESVDASLWTGLYIQAGNAEYMLDVAGKEENPAMKGVASILKAYIMSNITDTYGNVPYSDAAKIPLQKDGISYTTSYDDMKSIYASLFALLEEANEAFVKADELLSSGTLSDVNFSALCDYMYEGDVDKWRRFGNSLYLRLLMRASLKVEEEGGVADMSGTGRDDFTVRDKIAEIYDCFVSGQGNYPVMRSREDAALVGFSKYNSALYTPFYSTTSGIWNSVIACETLVNRMYDKTKGLDDPRYYYYFTKPLGAPTQLFKSDLDKYMDEHVSSAGNSKVGRYPYGNTSLSQTGNLQNADHYAMMNYSELLFIFAEAGQRGWLGLSYPKVKEIYLQAVTQSVLEWNVTVNESSGEVTKFLGILSSEIEADNALETILTQKWISMFWVGTEAWCDYRRTGYPLLKTNGPAAENNNILPTRLRYPADEKYRNPVTYPEALDSWLGGTDNMQTDVWWASTKESRELRLRGRQ